MMTVRFGWLLVLVLIALNLLLPFTMLAVVGTTRPTKPASPKIPSLAWKKSPIAQGSAQQDYAWCGPIIHKYEKMIRAQNASLESHSIQAQTQIQQLQRRLSAYEAKEMEWESQNRMLQMRDRMSEFLVLLVFAYSFRTSIQQVQQRMTQYMLTCFASMDNIAHRIDLLLMDVHKFLLQDDQSSSSKMCFTGKHGQVLHLLRSVIRKSRKVLQAWTKLNQILLSLWKKYRKKDKLIEFLSHIKQSMTRESLGWFLLKIQIFTWNFWQIATSPGYKQFEEVLRAAKDKFAKGDLSMYGAIVHLEMFAEKTTGNAHLHAEVKIEIAHLEKALKAIWTPYKLLEIRPGVEAKAGGARAIEKAFRKRSLVLHPDKAAADPYSQRMHNKAFQDLSAAKDLLLKEAERRGAHN